MITADQVTGILNRIITQVDSQTVRMQRIPAFLEHIGTAFVVGTLQDTNNPSLGCIRKEIECWLVPDLPSLTEFGETNKLNNKNAISLDVIS